MNKILTAATLAAVLLLGGCASGAKFASVEQPRLDSDNGRIYFYRPGKFVGAAIQPDIMLNGKKVGTAQPGGFFHIDRPPGNYEVSLTTEVKEKINFRLSAGETRYVRLKIGLGLVVGRMYPELVDESRALGELAGLNRMDA